MSKNDLFGLQRENKIQKSGVRKVFTPHQPIDEIDLLFGRESEVTKVIEQLNTPGQHCLLYGERGVGKSSLANIATQLIFQRLFKGKPIIKRCDSSDTFLSILEKVLQDCGYDTDKTGYSEKFSAGGEVGVNSVITLRGKGEKELTHTYKYTDITPSKAVDIIGDHKCLMLVDELDSVAECEKYRMAELIKLLSDNRSKVKILLVGIADTGSALVAGHPSVQRCLKENQVKRMGKPALESIISQGAKKVGLTFTNEVISSIVDVSAGYPHFTHLLALKCAEEAIGGDRKIINSEVLDNAIKSAAEDAEGTLKQQYDKAVRSYTTDMYSRILLAAALSKKTEFTASELREKLSRILQRTVLQYELNNYLKRLVSSTEVTILQRVSKGIYRFSDPRMPSYIKIVNKRLQQ